MSSVLESISNRVVVVHSEIECNCTLIHAFFKKNRQINFFTKNTKSILLSIYFTNFFHIVYFKVERTSAEILFAHILYFIHF